MACTIALTQGRVALVDDCDHGDLRQHNWHFNGTYAYRTVRKLDGRPTTLYMHRAILCPASGVEVDHVNGDGLDNRRANLRPCTHAQNIRNQKLHSDNTSGYRGVTWDKENATWRAQMELCGRHLHIGRYETQEEAARAYDAKAHEVHGAFARLNFPDGS